MRFECVNIRAVVSTSNRPEFTSPRGPLSLDQCESSSGLGCGPNQWPLVCLKVQLSKTIHSPEWVNANRQIEQQAKTGSDVEHSVFWEKKNKCIYQLTHPSVRPSMSSVSLRCLVVFFWPGPGSPAATLEPVPDPVWQQRGEPLGRPALGFIHSLLHHGGAGLLQHRRQLRTLERERIPRRRQLHPEIRQSLCLTVALSSNFILSFQPQKTLQCTGRRMLANTG